jgi:hypothetical protein
MSVAGTIALAVGGAAAAALFAAASAAADPGRPHCGQLEFVCNMLPSMPEFDHDVDMTKLQPPGTGVEHENLPPVDVCTVACI